jgi:hypothetical protein
MITLVDLGTIFWMGAQLWRFFVLSLEDQEQDALHLRVEQRFDRVFSLPTLLLLLCANLGVLVGAVSGPFNGVIHITSWDQLLSTAYGRALDLLVLPSIRPRLIWIWEQITSICNPMAREISRATGT